MNFTPLHPEGPAFQSGDEWQIKSSRKPRLLRRGVTGFTRVLDLSLRRFIFSLYHFVAPFASKTGLTRIFLGKNTIGSGINSFFNKIININLPEPIEAQGMIMYQGRLREEGSGYAFDYEPETRRAFRRIVKPGMTVVDAGANIGYYTLLAAKSMGNSGRVYAFEPDPGYYALLKKNIEVNRLNKIVELFQSAVGNAENKSTFFLGNLTANSFFSLPGVTTDKTIVVDVVSLDKFFSARNWPSVNVIKLDIEGSEKTALDGMRGLLKRNKDINIIIEVNPAFLEAAGTTAEELFLLLVELGFRQICILWKEMKSCKIPRDIKYLTAYSKNLGHVNLLCQRNGREELQRHGYA